jgi:purine-binding chemotaxis protein CheW
MTNDTELFFVCRLGTRLCGLPLHCVAETMRPLPIEALIDAPSFVIGLTLMRGRPVPVVDAGLLLGGGAGTRHRFVAVKTGIRSVALAVDAVIGIRAIPGQSLQELPPILGPDDTEIVTALGMLDNELLQVLSGIRCIPESIWAQIDSRQLE